MKKKILPLLLFLATSYFAHAVCEDHAPPAAMDTSETEPDTYLPPVENYLNFTVDLLRMDYLYNLDSKVSVKFHSMKKVNWHGLFHKNGAILYAIRLNQSRFALCPGIGWSNLYYAFAGTEDKGNDNERVYPRLKRESELRTECKDLDNKQGRVVSGSAVKIPFIDVLLRLRFNSVLHDPKAGFHTWLGVKFGWRQGASMIIDYKEYNESGASKVYDGHFNLKPYAFGVQAGVGYGRFGFTGGFHFTSLFKQNQGPTHSDLLKPFSFSIYVDLI